MPHATLAIDRSFVKTVKITREPIELYKILKFEGLAASGGEAKSVIADGLVKVNGDIETRKRRKIVSGDRVTFADEEIVIELEAATDT